MQAAQAQPRLQSHDRRGRHRHGGRPIAPISPLPAGFASSLAHAVIQSSDAPLLLLSADAVVLAASRSFCESFGIDPARAALTPLQALGAGEWSVPQLDALLLATAAGDAAVVDYEMNLAVEGAAGRCLVINAHKLDYPGDDRAMVLLSVEDVSEARSRERQKDRLVQEKAVLLQELQHRVANSLQIVASVLMQTARKARSEEARAHIGMAHSRMMSVADLQQLLTASQHDRVELRRYLTSLCRSIGASMIADPSVLTIEVEADDSVVNADLSLSLGLIVTELVINALKHAYPGNRGGRIVVAYASSGPSSREGGWSLTVRDEGVGMPQNAEDAKAGLGSSIVKALAMQLDAEVGTSPAGPGTLVSVTHRRVALSAPRPALEAV